VRAVIQKRIIARSGIPRSCAAEEMMPVAITMEK